MATTAYRVSGMTCGHCEHSVRQAVAHINGVAKIDVNAADGTLIVTSSAMVDDLAVRAAVEKTGYTVL